MEPYVEIHAIAETSPVWFMSGWIVLGFASGHVIHGIQGSAGKKDAGTAYGFWVEGLFRWLEVCEGQGYRNHGFGFPAASWKEADHARTMRHANCRC